MQFDERFQRLEKSLTQTTLMRASSGRRDQIDVGLTDRLTLFGPANAPRCPLAFSE